MPATSPLRLMQTRGSAEGQRPQSQGEGKSLVRTKAEKSDRKSRKVIPVSDAGIFHALRTALDWLECLVQT
jgi:hypothetical protein